MITAYALLLDRCGLSHREAAAFHGVRPDTVKSWAAGRNRVPPGAIAEVRALYRRIEQEAEAVLAAVPVEDEIRLRIAADDASALRLGWPCVGAHAAVLGIVAASSDLPVVIGTDVS